MVGAAAPGFQYLADDFEISLSLEQGIDPEQSGVYPVKLDLRSGIASVAELRTPAIFLVREPEIPLGLSWTFVLAHPIVFAPDGTFTDPSLEIALGPGGRLNGEIRALLELARPVGQRRRLGGQRRGAVPRDLLGRFDLGLEGHRGKPLGLQPIGLLRQPGGALLQRRLGRLGFLALGASGRGRRFRRTPAFRLGALPDPVEFGVQLGALARRVLLSGSSDGVGLPRCGRADLFSSG